MRISKALEAVERPVFVVGTMRSGTGFIGLQLNSCSSLIGCPFELRRIWNDIGRVPIAADVCGRHCPHLDESFIKDVDYTALKLAFAEEVRKNRGLKPWGKNTRFLSKNPHLCNKIDLVSELFPQAQFIWTIRDLYEVVCSLQNLFGRRGRQEKGIQHIWPVKSQRPRCFSVNRNGLKNPLQGSRIFPGGDVYYLAEYWLECNLSIYRFFAGKGKGKVLMVSQNQLFNQTDQTAQQLRNFLNLPKYELTDLSQKIDAKQIRQWTIQLSQEEKDRLRQFVNEHKMEIDLIWNKQPLGDLCKNH